MQSRWRLISGRWIQGGGQLPSGFVHGGELLLLLRLSQSPAISAEQFLTHEQDGERLAQFLVTAQFGGRGEK